jgi:hypothetical protein
MGNRWTFILLRIRTNGSFCCVSDHFFTQICCICQVTNLVSGKLALRYSGPALDAMKAVALAAKARSLADFQVQLFPQIDQLRFRSGTQVPGHFPVSDPTVKLGHGTAMTKYNLSG